MYTITNVIQRSIIPLHIQYSYIYIHGAIPLVFLSPCWFPSAPPLCPLLLTWHPPAVTGIVHLSLRLLVNWPHLPHPSPNCPTPPKSLTPTCPAPNKDDLGNIPALAIRNNYISWFYLFNIGLCIHTEHTVLFYSLFGSSHQNYPHLATG